MVHEDRATADPVKVMIVEDSRTQAEILKNTLEKYGYIPVVAENGRQALDMLEVAMPDVIISDVIMPVMDGYEFCRTVKNDERFKHIPLILLTMLTDSKDVVYAMVSGADNFITKPYQGDYLVSRLRKILSQKAVAGGSAPRDKPGDIILSGKAFTIPHDRQQIIEFLLSAYEAAVIQHQEVLTAQKHLSDANEEANLYLDIITHDINNVNTEALALTELLLMKVTADNKALAQRLHSSIHQSTEIIGNVSTIRKLHEKKEALRSIDLDEVIRSEILRVSGHNVSFAGTSVQVIADTLLAQVFTNLLGNGIKFSGPDAEISVAVRDYPADPGLVEIVIADDGPGISPEIEPVIFNRFRKGRNPRSGKGLGLFITRTLVESYGGTIWAEDRVPGSPEKGTAVHFTLKKAA